MPISYKKNVILFTGDIPDIPDILDKGTIPSGRVGSGRVESDIMKIVHSKKSICTHPVFGTRYSELGIRYWVFRTRYSILGMYSPITSLRNAWNVARYDTVVGSGLVESDIMKIVHTQHYFV